MRRKERRRQWQPQSVFLSLIRYAKSLKPERRTHFHWNIQIGGRHPQLWQLFGKPLWKEPHPGRDQESE